VDDVQEVVVQSDDWSPRVADGVADHAPKFRPLIVTETTPLDAAFDCTAEIAGASKENVNLLVPTVAATVTICLYPEERSALCPCAEPTSQLTVV
jgi:hypothetical protein